MVDAGDVRIAKISSIMWKFGAIYCKTHINTHMAQ